MSTMPGGLDVHHFPSWADDGPPGFHEFVRDGFLGNGTGKNAEGFPGHGPSDTTGDHAQQNGDFSNNLGGANPSSSTDFSELSSKPSSEGEAHAQSDGETHAAAPLEPSPLETGLPQSQYPDPAGGASDAGGSNLINDLLGESESLFGSTAGLDDMLLTPMLDEGGPSSLVEVDVEVEVLEGFKVGEDKIDLSEYETSYEDLVFVQHGDDLLVQVGEGSQAVVFKLPGVDLADIDETSFHI